jgi:hypothetical protein
MTRLFDELAPDVRADLESLRRELAPRREGTMLNTTYSQGNHKTAPVGNYGVLERERPNGRKEPKRG